MRRLSAIVPKPVLKDVYASLVHPYLIYAVEVWGHARCAKISKLSSIQNKCFRLFSTSENLTFISDTNFMYLNSITRFISLIKFFQILFENRSLFLKEIISNFQVNHSHFTRFSANNNLLCPPCNLSIRQFSFLYKTIKYWNDLPIEIRSTQFLPIFKRKLRLYFN